MAESKNDDGKCNYGVMNMLDSIPKFTGDDLTYSSTKWSQDLEDNAEIFGWSPQQTLIIARRSLSGTAELWLKTEKTFKTYEELKSALVREFPEVTSSKQMHEVMSNRKKRVNETYYQYMLVMKELGRRAKFPDYVSVQYIIDGITDYESNKLLFYGVTSYAALKEKLVLYETFKEKSKKQERPQREKIPSKQFASKNKETEGRIQRCYKCGEKGHLANVCVKGIKCFRCNSYGHIGSECKGVTGKETTQPSTSRRSMFVQQPTESETEVTDAHHEMR